MKYKDYFCAQFTIKPFNHFMLNIRSPLLIKLSTFAIVAFLFSCFESTAFEKAFYYHLTSTED